MNRHDENDDGIDPRMKLRANAGDKLHELQLRRDLDIINGRTASELGPLPPGGLPVAPRRKPRLPASASTMPLPMTAGHQENETMDFRSMAVAASMALAACAPVGESPQSGQGNHTTETQDADMDKPLRKLNPHPKRAYTITMTLADAPGPFAFVEAAAQFDVTNETECGEYLELPGVYPRMTTLEVFPLTKISDTEYQGTMYTDLILDEDYFGKGVCRWEFTVVSVALKATGAKVETRFLPDINAKNVLAQGSETKHFWSGYYPRANSENFAEFGDRTLDTVPEDKRHEFFAITLSSREAQP